MEERTDLNGLIETSAADLFQAHSNRMLVEGKLCCQRAS